MDRRVSWDRGPTGNWRHVFRDHPERDLSEEEVEEVLLAGDSRVVERRPPYEALVGRVAGTGRHLFVAYIPHRRGDVVELYPVHARQISAATWRKLHGTTSRPL